MLFHGENIGERKAQSSVRQREGSVSAAAPDGLVAVRVVLVVTAAGVVIFTAGFSAT